MSSIPSDLHHMNSTNTGLPIAFSQKENYPRWRQYKLDNHPKDIKDLLVPIQDVNYLKLSELQAIKERILQTNFVIYELPENQTISKLDIQRFGQQLGLYQLDHNLCADEESISSLQASNEMKKYYIPYTNKALSWHTDGYYNRIEQRIRAFILHCASPAASGGDNALLDPEMVYIQLRDNNPNYVEALMHPEAMTIPVNENNGEIIRSAQSGPVFSIDPYNGQLHMRYTARTRSIKWKNDQITKAAVAALEEILKSTSYAFKARLTAGQGVISNNILHNRAAFVDDGGSHRTRLMYRARYYDRIRLIEDDLD